MSKHKWQNQYCIREDSSQLHNILGEVFRSQMPFKNYACFQEVPVVDLCLDYKNPAHRFDWYIRELNLVLEVHGQQHYRPVNFGSQSHERVVQSFLSSNRRDAEKKQAAEEAGLFYLALPYDLVQKNCLENLAQNILEFICNENTRN